MEGAETETAEGFSPQSITYSQPGVYTIILVVDNGSNLVTVSKEVEVKELLDASFSILPSFEDIDDMEAPLRATFDVHLQGVETLKWECEGATFTDPTSADAMMLIPTAGTHTIYLEVSNGKQTKRVSQQIVVKENTNLRTHHNVRFGISAATSSIGAFYSTKLRQTIKDGDLNVVNGSLIDIAFFEFDNTFTRNMFVSPDQVSQTTLVDIPNASKTYFINKQELTNINLSIEQFESMTTDAVLKTLSIKSNSSNNELFSNEPMPRVILFETTDGRKGAILVKQMVQIDATSSYILTDIKIQKND